MKNFYLIPVFWCLSALLLSQDIQDDIPGDNPARKYEVQWTEGLPWANVKIMDPSDADPDNSFKKLQEELVSEGGGIIYFPPGQYHFRDHLLVESNIILRGAKPSRTDKFNPAVPEEKLMPIIDARDRRYELTSQLRFPEYDGTNRESSFKGIRAKYPETASNIAVVDLEIHNGHILIGTKEALVKKGTISPASGNIMIYGNILKNTAVADTIIPIPGQSENQIWIDRELGAITVYAGENILVAYNRIPRSGESNFIMKDFLLYPSMESWKEKSGMISTEVWFDYDNRSGIRVNFIPLVEGLRVWKDYALFEEACQNGGIEKLVTPGSMAKGIIIRDNYVFSTGKGGIKSTGWGSYIGYNIIRCYPDYPLPTYNGQYMNAFVNDTRAVEIRGWEWIIEGNDFEVYSNYTPDGVKYNDGEGLMHESWENIGIRNSIMRNNTGNQYLCFWRVPVNGLLIEGNRIRTKLEWHAIFVNGQTRFSPDRLADLPVNNVVIKNNITEGGGIRLLGKGEGNRVEGNLHTLNKEASIIDRTGAEIKNNQGYTYE